MKLAVNGIGLTLAGLEVDQLREAALNGTNTAPKTEKADSSDLNNYFAPRRLRRVDHFTRMTMLAACRALLDESGQGYENTPALPEDTGIVVSTGYGPSQTIFDFLDSIIEFGPGCASPLSFSHSVHNIPAATLSLFMGKQCPCTTLCQTRGPLIAGLNTAACWINEGRVNKVLLGAVDERTPILDYNTTRLLEEKNSCQYIPLTEGACFFLLSKPESTSRYGTIEFETLSAGETAKYVQQNTVVAPARSVDRISSLGINARSVCSADMPAVASVEMAALLAAGKKNACCIELSGDSFGVIRLSGKGTIHE